MQSQVRNNVVERKKCVANVFNYLRLFCGLLAVENWPSVYLKKLTDKWLKINLVKSLPLRLFNLKNDSIF